MKKVHVIVLVALLLAVVLLISARLKDSNPYRLEKGTPDLQSVNALTFGPDGILFIGDSKNASVVAIDTEDRLLVKEAGAIELTGIDEIIASLLGTEAENIAILDIAVNPLSKKIYCAVQSLDGSPVLVRIDGDKVEPFSVKDVSYSKVSILDAPDADAKDSRGRSLRVWAISDLVYDEGSVMVTGISNQEFSSTFRRIPFPFADKQDHASLEIFHAAHGKYETNAPIKTFTTAKLNGKKYLVASYTCTPLVLFPLDELKSGRHVKGRTVAEFGSGNSPIDMLSFTKGDESFLILANSSRPVMKVRYASIENFHGSLVEPVQEKFASAGVDFITLPVVNVQQMDILDQSKILVLQRRINGDLDLYSASSERWF